MKKLLIIALFAQLLSAAAAGFSMPVLFQPQDVYRHNDLKEHQGKLYMVPGHPGVLSFRPAVKWPGFKSAVLELTLPEGMSVLIYGLPQHSSNIVPVKSVQKKLKGRTVYTFTLNARTWRRGAEHLVALFGVTDAMNGREVKFQLKGDGKKGFAATFKVRTVKLPSVRYPEKFPMFSYYSRFTELPDMDIVKKNAAYLELLGVRGMLSPRNWAVEKYQPIFKMLRERKWWIGREINSVDLKALGIDMGAEFRTRNEHNEMINSKFSSFWDRYCPEYIIQEFRKRAGTRKAFQVDNCDGFYMDLEIYAGTRMLGFCRCDRCMAAFSTFSGIPRRNFNGGNVEKKYPAKWLAFREKQQADEVEAFLKLIDTNGKKKEFIFNSFFEAADNSFGIIKNSRYEKFTDYIMPMTYLRDARLFDVFDFNCRSTKADFLPMIYSVAGSVIQDWNTPAEVELAMVAAACCGSKGAAFFCNPYFDGLYALHMTSALNRIAAGEKYTLHGKRCDKEVKMINNAPAVNMEVDGKTVPAARGSLDQVRYTAHRRDGKILISVFNFGLGSAQVRMAVPKMKNGTYHIKDPVSGKVYFYGRSSSVNASVLRRGLPVELGERSCIQLEIVPGKAGKAAADPKFVLKERPANALGEVVEKRLSQYGMSIFRTDRNKNGRYSVKMESPDLELWIDLSDNGKIEKFYSKKLKKDFLEKQGIGMFRESFDLPGVIKLGESYEVVRRRIFKDRAELTLNVRITKGLLKDFVIQKLFTLYRDVPAVTVHYTVTVNRAEKQKADFAMRVQNRFTFGEKGDLSGKLAMAAVCGGKRLSFTGRQHLAFGEKGGIFAGYLLRTLKGKPDKPEVFISGPGAELKISALPGSEVGQFFSWRSAVPTAEIFFKKSDFSVDPHRTKIWTGGLRCELSAR